MNRTIVLTVICNIIIDLAYTVCVTVAAIHFDKPSILWWYVLLLCIGYRVKTGGKGDTE